MSKHLGSGDAVGYLLAGVLASDLRGWQALAAKELRRIVARHSDPPQAWLQQIWDFAHATLTSDPDEMTHLFALIQSARSDTVRNWVAEPLVTLAERESDVYRRWGIEGLECLISSGGSLHLRRFWLRIAALATSIRSPEFRRAAQHLLQLSWNQLRESRGQPTWSSMPGEKGRANVKALQASRPINQSLNEINKYPLTNLLHAA
jgi:hypothetical protein